MATSYWCGCIVSVIFSLCWNSQLDSVVQPHCPGVYICIYNLLLSDLTFASKVFGLVVLVWMWQTQDWVLLWNWAMGICGRHSTFFRFFIRILITMDLSSPLGLQISHLSELDHGMSVSFECVVGGYSQDRWHLHTWRQKLCICARVIQCQRISSK